VSTVARGIFGILQQKRRHVVKKKMVRHAGRKDGGPSNDPSPRSVTTKIKAMSRRVNSGGESFQGVGCTESWVIEDAADGGA